MKTILFSFIMLIAGLSLNAQALYVAGDNNSATTEIYVNGQDGSNPTLFVNGDLTVSNGKIDNVSGLVWIAGNTSYTSSTNGGYISTGKLVFNGGTSQTINGDVINANRVEVDNFNGVTIQSGTLNIDSSLLLSSGVFTQGSSASVILQSDAEFDAYLDDFTGSGSYAGQITDQLFVAGATARQHLISSPISGASVSSLDDDVSGYGSGVSGNGTDGVAVTPSVPCDPTSLGQGSNYGNLFEYNPTTAAASPCVDQGGWVVRSSGSLESARGYSAYLTGNGNILEIVGNPGSGSLNYQADNVIFSGSGNTASGNTASAYSGWDLIGNPYPSPMSRDAFIQGNTGVNSPSYYNPSGTYSGTYSAYSIGESIPATQGFAVRAGSLNGVDVTVNFSDAMRTTTSGTFRNDWYEHGLEVEVRGNGFADKTFIAFGEDMTPMFDPLYEAFKFNSIQGQPTLYTNFSDAMQSINARNTNQLGEILPLGLNPGADGTFTLTFSGMESFPQGGLLFLEDKATNTWQDLTLNDTYTFDALAQDNADRFQLHLTPKVFAEAIQGSCASPEGALELNIPAYTLNGQNVVWDYVVRHNGQAFTQGSASSSRSLPIEVSGNYEVELQYGSTIVHEILSVEVIEPILLELPQQLTLIEGNSLNITPLTNANEFVWKMDNEVVSETENLIIEGLTAGVYTVTLEASDNEGCTSSSSVQVFVDKGVASNNDLDISLFTAVAQNDGIQITLTDHLMGANIELFAMDGKLISAMQASATHHMFNTSDLAAGIYTITLRKGGESYTQQLLIQR
tara:strand:+ start:15535 stop:17916 length:2382 start_codon:yes stop_codon:yes gene_type:complete